MQSIQRLLALAMLTLAATQPAEAAMGLSQIEATVEDGPITLYYPTGSPSRTVMRGPFALQVAEQVPPARGNGRLVVVSHGSGGSPWVHHDLARQLVEAGFVVALPQHRGDNYLDFSAPGPDS
jgi:predicted dienelactone hydrolase